MELESAGEEYALLFNAIAIAIIIFMHRMVGNADMHEV